MFHTILIANRGEIACRIIRTARRLGMRSVAVFSEADATAMHVREADEAHPIGRAPAAQSYLRGEAILEVARRTGSQAIHPGYGFLSENADFAKACAAAGIAFIGPSPAAIRAMGSKAESKRLMVAAGVPTVPGYHGESQDDQLLAAEATRIGFPVLIKASAGGGGKGMRPVLAAEDFAAELAGARREAQAAFGDSRMLLEKYLQRPRHVEVQVFGDSHGRITHLHTRDCSLQRRHQKVIEEAPAPDLSDSLRAQLHEAAENAARAVGYINAGTVEFIVEGDDAFFLEMNTRLQVEHPVTEMITGLDLVEWQLRVAAGEALPAAWPPPANGHAVEARLYAEDPSRDFQPSVGRLGLLMLGGYIENTRVDAGVQSGDQVTSFYDPMIAKLVAWGETREGAIGTLADELPHVRVEGVTTNALLLGRLLRHPQFRAGAPDTGFIARNAAELLRPADVVPDHLVALAAGWWVGGGRAQGDRGGRTHRGIWDGRDGWRLFGSAETAMRIDAGGESRRVVVEYGRAAGRLRIDDGPWQDIAVTRTVSRSLVTLDGVSKPVGGPFSDDEIEFLHEGQLFRLTRLDPYAPASQAATVDNRLTAPIPGRIVAVMVAPGDAVKRGDPLVLLEAMKTEIRIAAPRDGIVEALGCAPGDSVDAGAELVSLTAPPGD